MMLCMNCKNVTVQKIDVSEGIDTKKAGLAKECMLCHYWYLKDTLDLNLNHMFLINVTMFWWLLIN